jgi:predicted nucleotide-binding protein
LIEAIFHHLERSDFVIVLLTADDEGHRIGRTEEKKSRARQNVVLELGIALGLLGRNRLLILYRRGVELPSDLQGLHYVEIGSLGDAKLKILAELKAAGISVDANKAFES